MNDRTPANARRFLRSSWLLAMAFSLAALAVGAGLGCSTSTPNDEDGASDRGESSSALGVSRIALDGGVTMLGDSSATLIDAGGPFPGTCDRCAANGISVTCINDGGLPDGTYAQSEAADCSIQLPQDVCDDEHLTTGSYSPDELQQKNQCQLLWSQGTTKSLQEFTDSCCSVRHEYGHICDPRYTDGGVHPDSRCTENFAQDSEQSCRDAVLTAACVMPSSLAVANQCDDACGLAFDRETIKIWDACMCQASVAADPVGANPAHLNSDSCCSCVQQCEDVTRATQLMPSFCTYYKGWQTKLALTDRARSQCLAVATGSGGTDANAGHGCGYYHGPSYFDPDACGKRCVGNGKLDIYVLGGTQCDASGPYTSYLYGTEEASTCEQMGRNYGGTFLTAGTSDLTVHNLSSGPSPDETCGYKEESYYCQEKGWVDYPEDVPPKICAPPSVEFSCVGHGVTCAE